MKLINVYFRQPILWDISISLTIATCLNILQLYYLALPKSLEYYQPVLSDLISSGFVIAGFVLTLLTILVTLKENSRTGIKMTGEEPIHIFFNMQLYFDTVMHLRNAIISVVLLSITLTIYRIFNGLIASQFNAVIIAFVICIYGATLGRTLLILSNITKLQKRIE